jgi:uncharacterized membrane protein
MGDITSVGVSENLPAEPVVLDADGISVETIFETLSSRRRRFVLHYLKQVDGQVTIRELSEVVTAWENHIDRDEVTPKQRKRVYTGLHQTHLPKMDRLGIVEYDTNRGTVSLTDHVSEFDIYLDVVPKDDIPWSEFYLALGSVLTRRVEDDLPIETMEAWSMLLGALLMHVVSIGLAESPASVQWTTEGVVALLYLAVVASSIGFLIYFDLLARLGPIEINLVSYAAPVAAAATGLVFLDERPTVYTVAGFLCILVGFALLKRDAVRELVTRSRP